MTNERKFEFKKLNENKYAFIMKSADIERTEVVAKDYARNHYGELVKQRQEIVNNISQAQKALKANDVKKDEELENFIRLADRSAQYKKFMQAEENLKALHNMLDGVTESMTQMEKVMPEVKRAKK